MTLKVISLVMIAAALAAPGFADEGPARFDIAGDVYLAGRSIEIGGEEVGDIYVAGETARTDSAVLGNAHALGRWVSLSGPVSGSVYAAGQTVDVAGPVSGNATVAGAETRLGEVAGDIRIFGSEVVLDGDVGGYAIVTGEFVTINGSIAGDLMVTARELDFGRDASVAGSVTLFEDEDVTLAVPGRVAGEDRVERRAIEDWEDEVPDFRPPGAGWFVLKFLNGVLWVTVLAVVVAALMPERLARLRERLLERPGASLVVGFVGLSAIIGSVIVFGLTLIGLLLAPGLIIITALAGFSGYVIGAYVLGVAILRSLGRDLPADLGDRVIAAAVGAVAAGLVGLLPFLGWLFVLALSLTGFGAILSSWLRPKLFAE